MTEMTPGAAPLTKQQNSERLFYYTINKKGHVGYTVYDTR